MRRAFLLVAALVSLVVANAAQSAGATSGSVIPGNTVGYSDGTWIVQLKDGVDADSFLLAHGVNPESALKFVNVFNGFSAQMTKTQITSMAAAPETEWVEADQAVFAQGDQTTGPVSSNITNSGALPWGLDMIDQRTATGNGHYVYSADGTGVKVYVVDTGVNAAHAEFGSRVVDGWSYRAQSFFMDDPDGAGPQKSWVLTNLDSCKDATYSDGSSAYVPTDHPVDVDTYDFVKDTADKGKTDNEGHGTHVAGIVGGSLTGVAKNVTIVPVRILNSCGTGTTTMAIYGIDWILGDHSNSQKAVVNMSIGFANRPCTFERLINGGYNTASQYTTCRTQPSSWLFGEGVVVVAAAGNDPSKDPCNTAPAGTPGTISVGAVGSTMREASYSAYGECVDIFAPGGSGYTGQGINSTWHYLSTDPANTSTYENEAGTSMAAPHVSGAVAQWLQGTTLPADLSTVPGLAWAWLKKQATCDDVSYYSSSRSTQTPNRFLNIGSAASAPCAPKNIMVTQASGSSVVSWSEIASGNGNDISGYRVTTSPSTAGCSTLVTDPSPLTCTLSGLTDGATYAVSVKAVTSANTEGTAGGVSLVAGTSGIATTTTTTPPTTTTVPAVTSTDSARVGSVSSSRSIVLSWPAVVSSESISYQVSVSPGGVSCTTSSTTCTFLGTTPGVTYKFSIVAKTSGGQSSVALLYSVTAGFNQKVFSVKKKSSTLLTKVVTTVSKGKRTYRVTSGKCRISAGRLVAPSAAGTCKVKVSIAKYRTYRAMSTTLVIKVA